MITYETKADMIKRIEQATIRIVKDAKINGSTNLTPSIIENWILVMDESKQVFDKQSIENFCSAGGQKAALYKWYKLENHPAIATTRNGLKNARFNKYDVIDCVDHRGDRRIAEKRGL